MKNWFAISEGRVRVLAIMKIEIYSIINSPYTQYVLVINVFESLTVKIDAWQPGIQLLFEKKYKGTLMPLSLCQNSNCLFVNKIVPTCLF